MAILAALLVALPFGFGPAAAQGVGGRTLPDVLAARVTTTPQRARLILDLSSSTEFAIVALDAPNRIAVDVKAANVSITTPQPVAGAGIVTGFTTVMAENGRVRTELILATPAEVQQAYVLDVIGDQPARLVVDLITTTPDAFATKVASDLAAAEARETAANSAAEAAEADQEEATLYGGKPLSPVPPAPPASTAAASSAAPPVAGTADLRPGINDVPSALSSLHPEVAALPETVNVPSATDGDSKPLVVIDPGHGGIDSGAEAKGIKEKDITLDFALQLRDLLVKSGRFDVALTRDDDSYLTLNERVDIARQNKADMFISLHADTFAENDIRGASIYMRDERATDVLDKVLADNENRRDVVAGFVLPEAKPIVSDILLDLMRRQMRKQSFVAASDIVKTMQPSVTLRRFPIRQADFFVLQAPDVPSLLIELGFLSNSDDIKNLQDPTWRDHVVDSIANGIELYFGQEGQPG